MEQSVGEQLEDAPQNAKRNGSNEAIKIEEKGQEEDQNYQEFKTKINNIELDDIERLSNSNEMVENIVCSLQNISND